MFDCFARIKFISGHLRTLKKCRKHSPTARVFYDISLVFSNACRVLSQCNTQLSLLHLLNKTRQIYIKIPVDKSSLTY